MAYVKNKFHDDAFLAAIGQRSRGVTRARNDEVIEGLDLFRTRGAHPRGDRQQNDRAEEREKVAKDVISFESSLRS